MRKTIFAALASTGLLLGASAPAAAGLLTPLVAGPDDAPQMTLVRGGCGFGGHRGFYGRCRPNYGYGRYGYGRHYHRSYFYRHY